MNGKYGFGIVRKGYDPEAVDAYIDELISRMKAMQEQNGALLSKYSEAQDMIRRYSETEKGLRRSIADSKRAAAEMLGDARNRSNSLVDTARVECNRIADELDRQIDEKFKVIDNIKANVSEFKKQLFELYSQHIEMVEELGETAERFEYVPDFEPLATAINDFEEHSVIEEPQIPEFPQMSEESFFAGAEIPQEEEAVNMTFGFEEPEEAPVEAVEEPIAEETAEELYFEEAEIEAAPEEMEIAEELAADFAEFEETEAPEEAEAVEETFEEAETEEDEMFTQDKEKEDLFNFLKDFVNGSEE